MCILTGDGLKDAKAAIKPPTIYPQTKEFLAYIKMASLRVRAWFLLRKADVLFTKEPTKAEIIRELQKFILSHLW